MRTSQLRTLGSFEFSIDGKPVARPSTQKARALLACLVMRRGSLSAREDIIETFWPDSDPDNARQSLNTALWSIRRSIRSAGIDPAQMLSTDNFTVRWNAPTSVDALDFEKRALAADTSALELYRGDFLPGDYDTWSSAERERLIHLLEKLLAASLSGTHGVSSAQRLLQLDPFNEEAYATLIDAELQAGRTVPAQTLLMRFRQVLSENGLTASAAFEQRFSQLESKPQALTFGERFVGRARELALFEQMLRADKPPAIVMFGDAGFGKTTLLERFARRIAQAGHTVVTLRVREDAGGFGGWEDVYADRTRTAFSTLAAERGVNVSTALADAIVETLPPGSYVAIDDAQRLAGDAAFVTASILSQLRNREGGVIVATRPEGLKGAMMLVGERAVMEMPLAGLSEDEIRTALPPGAAGETTARALYERTQGHPLFLRRLLEQTQGGELQLDMPISVRSLIGARLSERGEDARMLACALALDPHFQSAELAALLEWNEERVLDGLDDLLSLGIIRESGEVPHLQFTHDVVKEVARDSLSSQRRRKLHRMAASLLERAQSVDAMARSAEHLLSAGEHVSAANAFLRCGELTLDMNEPRNAAVLLDRARRSLEQTELTPQTEHLLLQIEIALIRSFNASAQPEQALRVAAAAITRAQRLDKLAELLALYNLRANTQLRFDSLDDVTADAERAMKLAERLGDNGAYAEACIDLTHVSRQRMQETQALHYARAGVDAALAAGDLDFALFALGEMLHVQVCFWRLSDALKTAHEGEELLQRTAGGSEANFRYNRSQLFFLLERQEDARREIERALEAARNMRPASRSRRPDRQHTFAVLHNMRGLVACKREDWDDACDAVETLWSFAAVRNNVIIRTNLADLAVRAYLGRGAPGDLERAQQFFDGVDESVAGAAQFVSVSCARALLAARTRSPNASTIIEGAYASAKEFSEAMPLEADTAFGMVAQAAREIGADAIAQQAAAQQAAFLARRCSAAGSHWGGSAV